MRIQAAKQLDQVLTCDAQVELEAAASEDGLPRFTMVAYTGAPMRPGGWWRDHPLILDISGMQKPPSGQVPIHRAHDPLRVVGHSEAITGGSKVLIKGIMSVPNTHNAEVVGASKNKFPWQASVGARLLAQPDFIGEGQTVTVNGQKYKGPVYVGRRWLLNEASFVSMGADSATSAIAAAEDKPMNEFEKWLQAQGVDPSTLTDEAKNQLQAAYDALQAGQQEDDEEETPQKEVKAGNQQSTSDRSNYIASDISAAVATAVAAALGRQNMLQASLGAHPDLLAKAIAENWDEGRCRSEGQLATLRASYSHGPAIHVQGRPADRAQVGRMIEAAMSVTGGVFNEEQAVAAYGEQTVEAAQRHMPRSAGLKYLIHEVIRASGGHSHPGVMDDDTIRAAFQADRQLSASSGFSTISLSGILSNLANKALLRAYNEVPSVVRRFCRTVSHSDFKQHTKYRLTTPNDLDKLGPTGEIKHTELDEDSYTNQVETFARMMSLTRVMMRNDDLGAFLQIPAGFGRMAARTHEKSVFTVLLDNTGSFFNSSASGVFKANALAAGAGSALSVNSLRDAEILFWSQEDKHGNPIDLVPSILLVSPTKYRDASNIVNRTTVTVAGDPASTKQLRVGNEFLGQFEPIQSPYMQSSAIVGSSPNKWFLFAAPSADVAVIEIAYLDGRQTPVIESAETDFNTLGMQWRSYWDWGVAKQDKRAAVYSPGA